jgi:hypothetical protein
VSVKIQFGPAVEEFPWWYGHTEGGPSEDLMPSVPGLPSKRVIVMAKMNTSGRVAILLGFRHGSQWWTCISSKTESSTNKVIGWHKESLPINADRAFKAIAWTETHFGQVKVKNVEEWFKEFRKAWETKPWA